MQVKTILWDWNGTLLNDVIYAHDIVNLMLSKRGKHTINIEEYRAAFSFPIRDYYRKIGFEFTLEKEYYSIVNEFNYLFARNIDSCELFVDAKAILEFCKSSGIDQFIVSGLNNKDLLQQIHRYKIFDYFEDIRGSKYCDATDKVENGKKLIEDHNVDVASAIYIGDTVEDYNAAKKWGCAFVFFNKGHQLIQNINDIIVVERLWDLKNIIDG